MSLIVKHNTTQEINASLLELRKKADKAISDQAALKLIVYNNLDSLNNAFNRVGNLIYQITYYQSIINQGKYGLIEVQRNRLQAKVDELEANLATLRQQLSNLQTRRNEIGAELDSAKSTLNSLINNYNNWITNTYNPTKSSIEAEIAEYDDLIEYYQEQVDYYTEQRDSAEDLKNEWDEDTQAYLENRSTFSVNITPPFTVEAVGYNVGPNDYGLTYFHHWGVNNVEYYTFQVMNGQTVVHTENYTFKSDAQALLLNIYNQLVDVVETIDDQIEYYQDRYDSAWEYRSNLYSSLQDLEEQKLGKEAAIATQQSYVNQLQAEYDAIPAQISNVRNEINQTQSDLDKAEEALEDFNERYPTS